MKKQSKETLRSTTTSLAASSSKSSINPDSLCKIIEACKTAGVKEFRSGDLYISFVSENPLPIHNTPEERQPERLHTEQPILQPIESHDEEQDLGNLLISDPVAYEEALMRESNG